MRPREPEHWSGEESLLVVAFLESLIHTIWTLNGAKMGIALKTHYDAQEPQPPDPNDDTHLF